MLPHTHRSPARNTGLSGAAGASSSCGPRTGRAGVSSISCVSSRSNRCCSRGSGDRHFQGQELGDPIGPGTDRFTSKPEAFTCASGQFITHDHWNFNRLASGRLFRRKWPIDHVTGAGARNRHRKRIHGSTLPSGLQRGRSSSVPRVGTKRLSSHVSI